MNSDWELFFDAQRGDEISWRALVEEHQPRLKALAMLITGSADAADDIVQDSFTRALQAKIRHTTGSVYGFLTTIAYRLALKEKKRSGRETDIAGMELTQDTANPLETQLTCERDKLIMDAIGSLEKEQRDVLVLRFYGDRSYEEIAEIMKIPLGTVKSRIFYAVKSCREKLREKGVLNDSYK